jgi:predicted Zn-dependent peptidase
VHRAVLANSLRVIVAPLPHLPEAYVGLWLRAGARYDDACGLSHFTEHLLHAGSRRYPNAHARALAIERIGGRLLAQTSEVDCAFRLRAPPSSIDEASSVIAEMVCRPLLRDARVERARVLEEILEDEDAADDAARSLVFRDHPLGRSVLGGERHVRELRMVAVRRWHRRIYCARNAVVVYAGKVSARTALRLARRDFGAMRAGRRLKSYAPKLNQQKVRVMATVDESQQTSLRFCFRAAGGRTPALDVLVELLDGGDEARLPHRLLDASGACYTADAELMDYGDASYLQVTAPSRRPAFVTRQVLAIVTDLARRGPTLAELEVVRRRIARDPAAMADAIDDVGAYHAIETLYEREARTIEDGSARRVAVTADEVRDAARDLASPRRLSVVVSGPARQVAQVKKLVRAWPGWRGR